MIIVNSRFLTQPITGVQRFAIEISRELKKMNVKILFLTPKNIVHHQLATELNAQVLGRLTGHLWEQLELYSYVSRKNALLISLCNTGPLFLRNQIVTIHDIAYKICPEWFSKSFVFFYNFLIPQLLKVSKAVITVSSSSKKELVEKLNVSEEKITVVYNAVAPIFQEENVSKMSLSKIGVEGNYILTVSSHHPRKNFERLVQAFRKMENKNLKLCIIGNINKDFNSDTKVLDDNIFYLNDVSDKELVAYYKFAKLFVFPSLYEGFGIPIIEAMSQNTKVCVSDIPVFREICGEDAIYFDPYDIDDIANKIIISLSESHFKSSYKELSKFSWEESAVKILSIIKQVQIEIN
ncbi:glycosyltransferase family 4 protein [Flavobacterium sp. 3-218]